MTPAWSCLVTSNCSFVIGASADPIWRSSWTAPPNKSCPKAEIRCIWQRLTVGRQWAHICCYIRNILVIVLKYTCWWGVGGGQEGGPKGWGLIYSAAFPCRECLFGLQSGTCAGASGSLMRIHWSSYFGWGTTFYSGTCLLSTHFRQWNLCVCPVALTSVCV